MGFKEDLEADVAKIFAIQWTTRDGTTVPEDKDVGLEGNDAVKLTATVLYADLSSSTILVDSYKHHFSAEIYKSYLFCAGKIIRNEGGVITAYDGDRIMAVFIGGSKNTSAVKAGLKIHFAVEKIINPALKKQYSGRTQAEYNVKHVVGIDTSDLFVARTGVRGANDLVWVGRAANYAAKLSSENDYRTYITKEVYNSIDDEAKYGGTDKKNMWTSVTWKQINNVTVYGSNWWWWV